MGKKALRNRQRGINNAFKKDIMKRGVRTEVNGRVYCTATLKSLVRKDPAGRVIATVPRDCTVRVI
jgi:hypothetical protein